MGMPGSDRQEMKAAALRDIAAEVARCQNCALHRQANKSVPGEGNPDATVMLIGEAPGWNENQQGRPFVWAAGQFLEELLRSVGLRREDVFIANVVKHWPPQNRDPEPDEIGACAGFLDRQIAAIDPRVIVTLGRFSMTKFFPGERISRIHGEARRFGNRLVLPLYHPAAALHQGSLRRVVEEDFRRLPAVVAEAARLVAAPPAPTPPRPEPAPEPKQLSLF